MFSNNGSFIRVLPLIKSHLNKTDEPAKTYLHNSSDEEYSLPNANKTDEPPKTYLLNSSDEEYPLPNDENVRSFPNEEVHPFHTEEAQDTLRFLDKVLGGLNIFVADALGRPFEFSDRKELIELRNSLFINNLHMLDAGSYSGNHIWPMIKAGQWTDDAAHAACWMMTIIYVKHFIKKKKEQDSSFELTDTQRRNLYTNMFSRLLYQWFNDGLVTGLTVAQQDEEKIIKKQHSSAIGCGGIVRKCVQQYWPEVERNNDTSSEDFLLNFDSSGNSKTSFYHYLKTHNQLNGYLDGNSSTMRNISGLLAETEEEAMKLAGYQATTTTKGPEAFVCAQLQAWLTFKALHSKIKDPEQAKKEIFNRKSLAEFLDTYKKLNKVEDEQIPSKILALCASTEDTTDKEDTRWLNWREDDYILDPKDTGDYYGGYVTKGLALIFYVINHTTSYKDALLLLAELSGDADSNCAAAQSILGALYGQHAIDQKYSGAVNQHSLTQRPLEIFGDRTNEVLKLSTPPDVKPEEAKASDLMDAALFVAQPELCQNVRNLTKQVHQKIDKILHFINVNKSNKGPEYDQKVQQGFKLLEGMHDKTSIAYKKKLLQSIANNPIPDNAQFITRDELGAKKFSWEFIKEFYINKTPFYLFEASFYLDESSFSVEDEIKPLQVKNIYTEYNDITTLNWMLYFHGDLEKAKGKKADIKLINENLTDKITLINYLASLEYDSSQEAEEFKCAAFSFLLGKKLPKWNKNDFSLAHVLGCEQIITGQQEYFINNDQIRLNNFHTYRYREVIEVLRNRHVDVKEDFTEDEINQIGVKCETHKKDNPLCLLSESWNPDKKSYDIKYGKIYLQEKNGFIRYVIRKNDNEFFDKTTKIPAPETFTLNKLDDFELANLTKQILATATESNHYEYKGRYAIVEKDKRPKEFLLYNKNFGEYYIQHTFDSNSDMEMDNLLNYSLSDQVGQTLKEYPADQEDCKNKIRIPISGTGGEGEITVARFEGLLKEYTGNQTLDIKIPSTKPETTDNLELHLYADKEGRNNLMSAGLIFSPDKNYFKLTISPKPDPDNKLFGVSWVNGTEKYTFATPHLTQDEKIGLIYKPNVIVNLSDGATNTLNEMRHVNQYFKEKATEAGYFHSGSSYYKRRQSWESILERMNQCIKGRVTIEDLLKYIQDEASNYQNHSKFRLHASEDRYSNCLLNLSRTLSKDSDLKSLKEHIIVYQQAYAYMDENKKAAEAYYDNFNHLFHSKGLLSGLKNISFFSNIFEKNETLKQEADNAEELYKYARKALKKLDANEKKNFLSAAEQRIAEYDNYRFK